MTSTAATGQHGRSYESSQHGVTVVKGFQRLWQETLMCDTQLVVQGQSFNVHRAYLAACSQYFYSMFTKDFQEKSQNQVIDISCCYRQMCCDTLTIVSIPCLHHCGQIVELILWVLKQQKLIFAKFLKKIAFFVFKSLCSLHHCLSTFTKHFIFRTLVYMWYTQVLCL